MPKFCCDTFDKMVGADDAIVDLNRERQWEFGEFYADATYDDGIEIDPILRFCPFCGTKVDYPDLTEEIAAANTALRIKGVTDFNYYNAETTANFLDHSPRDNPKRVTPGADGIAYSCYRCLINGKWRWRDRTTLIEDQRTLTTVHDQFERGPIYGARLTDDAIYVITARSIEDAKP